MQIVKRSILFLIIGLTIINVSSQVPDPETVETTSDTELAFMPTYQLAEKIKMREVSSERITHIYLSRIEQYNPVLRAIATLETKGAIEQAQKADAALERGEVWGPLHGVPITVKDNYKVKGMRSTAGYKPLKDYIPEEDATIVKRLKEAGAIILGKTNMPAMGMDNQSYNEIFGTTANPWDTTRTPGGSSGGCAAAVAAGLTSFSIGNDIGGSIRGPAHFNGVYGIKTTENFIPETGMVKDTEGIRLVRHLATHGPIARSAHDLQLILKVIAGGDGIDYETPRVVTEPQGQNELSSLEIAWDTEMGEKYVSPKTKELMRNFIHQLDQIGVHTQKASPDNLDYSETAEVYMHLFTSEAMADITGFERTYMCWTTGLCPEKRAMKYFDILDKRDKIAENIEIFLREYDIWIIPVTSEAAFKHRKAVKFNGPLPVYAKPLMSESNPEEGHAVFCAFTNLSGHPSVVIPIGYDDNGMPIGVQLVGRRWYDAELIQIASQLAEVASAYKRPPGFD